VPPRFSHTSWTTTNSSRFFDPFLFYYNLTTFAKALHYSLPPFAPVIPTNLLPYLTGALLIPTFALAFYFSTYVPPLISESHSHILFSIPKHTVPVWETVVASIASILGGFGVVALFCSVGVYV
jgi:Oligosaccharyltransferase subunit 5